MFVGDIILGASSYDDDVYAWLTKHAEMFDVHEMLPEQLADTYDFWRAWGLLAFVGCKVEAYGCDDDVPEEVKKEYGLADDDTSWGMGVKITFDGTVQELINRLDSQLESEEMRIAAAPYRAKKRPRYIPLDHTGGCGNV